MTQPPNNDDPYGPYGPDDGDGTPGSGRNDRGQGNGSSDASRPSYPQYPATPHPEDSPGGFRGYDQPGHGGAGYAGYGRQGPAYGQGPASGQRPMTQGDGRVNVMMAVRFAFSTVFSNALVWLLGTFGFLVVLFGISLLSTMTAGTAGGLGVGVTDLLVGVVSMVISVFIYNGALRQVDRPKIGFADFVRNINFWPTIAVLVITGVATSIITALVTMALVPTLPANPAVPVDPQLLLSFLGGMLGVALLMLVISPLYSFMPWYAADRREGIGGAIRHGFRDGARNYLRLVAYHLVASIMLALAAMVTLGLAMIVLAPALMLSFAHLYRQMSGGQVPVA